MFRSRRRRPRRPPTRATPMTSVRPTSNVRRYLTRVPSIRPPRSVRSIILDSSPRAWRASSRLSSRLPTDPMANGSRRNGAPPRNPRGVAGGLPFLTCPCPAHRSDGRSKPRRCDPSVASTRPACACSLEENSALSMARLAAPSPDLVDGTRVAQGSRRHRRHRAAPVLEEHRQIRGRDRARGLDASPSTTPGSGRPTSTAWSSGASRPRPRT